MANERWHWQEWGEAWKGVGLYHVTLTIPSRQPLLGRLDIPDGDATKATIERTALGDALVDALLEVPRFHPAIQILHFCLMPDHLHAVWYVRQEMSKGIGESVRGFWQGIKKLGRTQSYLTSSSISPNGIRENFQEEKCAKAISFQEEKCSKAISFQEEKRLLRSLSENLRGQLGDEEYYAIPAIFTEMPFIRPMGQRRQLPATLRYIDMNPQRLATKRLKPDMLRVQSGIEIAGRSYSGVGNMMLLQAARFASVHVRRLWVEEAERHGDNTQLRDYMNNCVKQARQGTVMVSPFISPQEKQVMEVLLKERLPFIYLADNGFREYYKPQDSLFEAVSEGWVLILSPWEYDNDKRHISRADCVALNKMAEEICTLSFPN